MRKLLLTISFVLFAKMNFAQQNFNLELLGHFEFDTELSDVWGYADEFGNEYAIVGRYDGVSIIDVSNPPILNEVYSVDGLFSTWRDMKTWGDYAYITCECGPGLMIINMESLPDENGIQYTYWIGDTFTFQSAHNLYIDENGIAYIFGSNFGNGGAVILDLTTDPMNPQEIGLFDENYLHDGVVRGDTLWGGAVYQGDAQAIDVSDKLNPQLITAWKTPSAFSHNIWFSDNNDFVFTTDEVRNGSIAAYDVSNVLNPTRLDVWSPNDTGIIPHNTHFINDFLVTSHYTIGVNIIDVSRPNNMVETGRYDTAPDFNYEGFSGCWGAYPYLPSGHILATDIETGLYLFDPKYLRGCYLEGTVTNQHTGGPIFFPNIEIVEDSMLNEIGSIVGKYAIATPQAGSYTVKVSADGFRSKIIEDVQLANGQLTILDVQLSDWPEAIFEFADLDAEISLFPNPSKGFIELSADVAIDGVKLFSAEGREFKIEPAKSANGMFIPLGHLMSGLYFLNVQTPFGVVVKRVVNL